MNLLCSACESDNIFEVIFNSLKCSLEILPFLLLSYLLVEYINSKHSKKMNQLFNHDNKLGPLLGASVGLVPQCGFSSTISTLYINKLVSIGTLFAVFISTSDEAMVLLISNGQFLTLAMLLASKFFLALIVGFSIDFVLRNKKAKEEVAVEKIECTSTCCSSCKRENSFIKNAFIHALQVFIFVVISSLLLEVIIFYIGHDTLETILLSGSMFQPVIACLIGLIPNCASSVLITNLYICGSLSFASLLAGLMCNAGVGMIVLFKVRKNFKKNLLIVFSLLAFSIIIGMITHIIMGVI